MDRNLRVSKTVISKDKLSKRNGVDKTPTILHRRKILIRFGYIGRTSMVPTEKYTNGLRGSCE